MDMVSLFVSRLISALLIPPWILILFALGVLLKRNSSSFHRIVFGVLPLLTILLLSMPFVSEKLQSLIEMPCQPLDQGEAQAIVILGGGVYREAKEYGSEAAPNPRTLERLRYGAYLHRKMGLPVLVTGGAVDTPVPEAFVMREVLQSDFQLPVRWVEDQSLNTLQNAEYSATLLKNEAIHRILLVSHSWHLPRATTLFEAAGFEVIPAPTVCGRRTNSYWMDGLPSAQALSNSHSVLRELVGQLAYRLQSAFKQIPT